MRADNHTLRARSLRANMNTVYVSRALTLALLLTPLLTLAACGGTQTQTARRAPTLDDIRRRAVALPDSARWQKRRAVAELLWPDGDPVIAFEQLGKARALRPEDTTLALLLGVERQLHGYPAASLDALMETIQLARTSNEADARFNAEVAVAAMTDLLGIAPNFPSRVRPFLDEVLADPGRLGGATEHELRELAIELAFRRGDKAAADAFAAPCITDWKVAGPFGPRELLGFDRSFPPEEGALAAAYDLGPSRGERPVREIEARGCSSHLGNGPVPMGGTTYAVGEIEGGDQVLRLETPNSVELRIDGEVVIRLDRRREPTPRVTFHRLPLSPGTHQIMLKVTTRHPNPVVIVSSYPAFDASLDDANGPYHTYLNSAVQLARGDVVGARETLHDVEDGSPVVTLLKANVALADPLRGDDIRRDEARRLLRIVAERDGNAWFPILQLANLTAAEGRDQEALSVVKDAADRWPEIVGFPITTVGLLLNRGWDAQATEYIARARAIAPEACVPIQAELASAQRHDRTAEIEQKITALMECDARSNERYSRLRTTRRWDEAGRELERLASLEPAQARNRIMSARLDLAESRGDQDAVDAILSELAALRPLSADIVRTRADRLLAGGDRSGALQTLDSALAREPEAMSVLRRVRTALGGRDEIASFRLDGAEALREFEASGREYTEPQVLVLDYTAVRVFEDGSSLSLTHQIYKVQSEEAIDAQGEFSPPQGQLLTLHTIKSDGTRLEPDLIEGKETISMPNLQIGDYVEYEYLQVLDAPIAFPRGVLGDRFFFQSFEVPFDRTELIVIMPEDMQATVDPRGPAPTTQRTVADGLAVYKWRLDESRPVVREPGSVNTREFMPSINWGIGATWELFVENLIDVLADRDVADPADERLVREITLGARTQRERAERIYDWVLENVESSRDLFGLSAAMVSGRTGNRARVLHYLFGLAEIPSKLVLIRGFGNDQTRSDLADDDTYSNLLVMLGSGESAMFVSAAARGVPFGYVAPALRGQDALVLEPGENRIEIPRETVQADTRRISIDLVIARDGTAVAEVTERYTGLGAISWRGDLEGIPAAMLDQRFEEAYASRVMPAATMQELRITGQENADEPLTLRYTLAVPSVVRRQGNEFILPAGLFASYLARTFARQPSRTQPMLIAPPVDQQVRIRVRLPQGASFTQELAPTELTGPHGARFEMQTRVRDNELRLMRDVKLPLARLSPEEYPAFAEFCRAADAAEQREIHITM